MDFSDFSKHLLRIEETSSRLEMAEQLSTLFLALPEEEIAIACYLMQGSLVPSYQSLEFQMSVKMVLRALEPFVVLDTLEQIVQPMSLFEDDAAGKNAQSEAVKTEITRRYKELGDIGLLAETLLASQEHTGEPSSGAAISIQDVYQRLKSIAELSGAGSQEAKVESLTLLLKNFMGQQSGAARYVCRIVIGKLRLGFSTMTMLDALSWAVGGDKKEASFLEEQYQKRADVGTLAHDYLELKSLTAEERQNTLRDEISVTVGVPVVPALCQRLNTAQEIIDKMEDVIVEPKYDGLRVQIHIRKQDNFIAVFTRNLENITHMFPELWDGLNAISANAVILDAEAIGYDPETGKLLPFQATITRRRKHNVAAQAAAVPIRFYIFDMLLADEQVLLSTELRTRKELLKNVLTENEVFLHAPFTVTQDPEKVRMLHNQYLAEKLEGAVIKQIDSQYVSGRKGWNWVKIKEAEGTQGKLNDTLDCVVMGYYKGRGKRASFGIGAILVGVVSNDTMLTIAKIGTGLSDQQLSEMKKLCDALATSQKPDDYSVPKEIQPDVWTTPQLVVEIAADELTISPLHSAGKALRFPRLLHIRKDKNVSQATTVDELAAIEVA